MLETNFEIKGYGSIKIEYGYIEGEIRPIDFKVTHKWDSRIGG